MFSSSFVRNASTVCVRSTSSVRDMRFACSGNRMRRTARCGVDCCADADAAVEEVDPPSRGTAPGKSVETPPPDTVRPSDVLVPFEDEDEAAAEEEEAADDMG